MFIKPFSAENYAVYKITWNNMVEADRPQMTIYSQYGAEEMPFVRRIKARYGLTFVLLDTYLPR